IARLLDDDANLTRTGFTFGTPAYMAPEQAMGRKALIGPRTDLYAVGATMFTMLTGDYVQDADNAQALLVKIATQPARSLADLRPDSSIDLVHLVDRATMMHVEDRWPSAEAMLARVRMAMRERRLDGSRRHISSRISAMILPGLDGVAHDPDAATYGALETAGEVEEDPFALDRESGVDRTSVIRGRHTIPQVSSTDQAPPLSTLTTLTTTTRRSLVSVRRPRRFWAFAAAAAVVLVGGSIAWKRGAIDDAPPARTAAQTTEATTKVAIETTAAAVSPPIAVAEGLQKKQPEIAVAEPASTASTQIAPQVAPIASPKPPTSAKPIRRPIDVGY
ncbi:MAG: hypothetical protein ABI175_02600, partial [Polyangiales bacterium]